MFGNKNKKWMHRLEILSNQIFNKERLLDINLKIIYVQNVFLYSKIFYIVFLVITICKVILFLTLKINVFFNFQKINCNKLFY